MRKTWKSYHHRIIPLCRRNRARVKGDSRNLAKAKIESQESDSFLCKRCRKINLDKIFSLKPILNGSHHIFNFRSASAIVENGDCSFCQAFEFINPPDLVQPGCHQSRALVAAHREGALIFDRDVLPEDSIFLTTKAGPELASCVWRMGYARRCPVLYGFPGCLALPSALRKERDLFLADSISSKVDLNMLKSWIKTCEKKHGNYCAPDSTENSTLRLIDCDSKRVVATPKPLGASTYAALSYVWGSQEQGEVCSEELPKQLPKTIEDAITVTKGLGIPYLWVDRYCINQNDEREKHCQCSLMHRIYENAHVTIIAAAGSGPDHGLPGIGSSTRSYPSVRIGSRLLVPTLPDPRLSIQAAKWSTRGWTYQEGQLSKRRLIFTDRQVLFVCRRACTDEAEQKLKPDTELPDGDIRPSTSLSPFCMSGKSPHKVWDDINQFSKLDLSRQEDSLNAMLGILQRYQESDWKDGVHLRHLAGLPAVKKEPQNYKRLGNHEYSAWTPAICESLGWRTSKALERRDVPHPGFPSWSWTAWKAAEDRARKIWLQDSPITSHWSKSIIVERPDGGSVEGYELDSLLETGHDFSRIRFIHLKAPSLNFTIFPRKFPASLLPYSPPDFFNDLVCVVRHHDAEFLFPFELTDSRVHIPEDGLHCCGIMVVENLTEGQLEPVFLVVTKVKDWYERIGVALVHDLDALKALETRSFRLG